MNLSTMSFPVSKPNRLENRAGPPHFIDTAPPRYVNNVAASNSLHNARVTSASASKEDAISNLFSGLNAHLAKKKLTPESSKGHSEMPHYQPKLGSSG